MPGSLDHLRELLPAEELPHRGCEPSRLILAGLPAADEILEEAKLALRLPVARLARLEVRVHDEHDLLAEIIESDDLVE